MTAQIHEVLILNGTKASMAFCPSLPKDNPRLIELKGYQGLNTACWRGYQGSWEIKDRKFFLTGIRGKYQLSDGAPIFANWFTGTIKVPVGDILRYVHGGFATVYEQEINITIQNGFVKSTITTDNRPPSSKTANIEQKQRDSEKEQEQLEEEEFLQLVAEMKKFGFTHSGQVSSYIVSNRLGYKYKNISGILQMELDGTTWNFKGGFPPKIYARLCDELELSNNETRAKAVAFESFGNVEHRSNRK